MKLLKFISLLLPELYFPNQTCNKFAEFLNVILSNCSKEQYFEIVFSLYPVKCLKNDLIILTGAFNKCEYYRNLARTF